MGSRFMKCVAIIVGLIAVVLTVSGFARESLIFVAGGFWALLLVLIPPSLTKQQNWFSIWSFVILTVGIGMTARGIFISFDLPNHDEIDRLYLLGHAVDFFVKPLVILLLGLGMMTAGYLSVSARRVKPKEGEWDQKKVVGMGVIVLIISGGCALLYVFLTGGFSSNSISAKRTPIPGLDLSGQNFKSYGILRHLSSLAIFAHLIVLTLAFKTRNRIHFALAFALFLVACVQPFYASVRTAVAANFIFSAAVIYFCGGRVSRRWLVFSFAGIAVMVAVMTALRPGIADQNVLESIVLNRNQIELPKTAHIINAVPETLDFQYGKTLTRWLAAPIPREVWPDKPVIHPGPIIGNRIYGQRVAGVPPGLIAELWWNFGWFGIFPGAFVFGGMLRWLENRFGLTGNPSPAEVVIFIAGPMLIGFEAVGSSIGSGVFKSVLGVVVIAVLLRFVSRK